MTLLDDLASLLGDELLIDDDARRSRARDTWPRSEFDQWQARLVLPAAIAMPSTTERVAETVRLCRAHGAPMIPRGAGSGCVGGVLASPDSVVISTEGMSGLRSLDPVDGLASFGAGTMGIDAENRVRQDGFTIGHWPQSIEISSVGGWVATRASGQYSTAYGNIEDIVYSVEAVLPDGSIYRSRPTPRASAGPDLRQLLLGSEGALGIITEVTFSLRPLPEPGVRQAFHFEDMATGIDAVRGVIVPGWLPPVVRLYDAGETRRHFRDHVPKGRCVAIFLHEGPPGHAALEAVAVAELCRAGGGEQADLGAVDHWFEHRNTVPTWTELFEQGLVADTIEVATGWGQLARLYTSVTDAISAVPKVIAATAHSSHAYRSGANLYFTFAAQPSGPEEYQSVYDACWTAAMQAATGCGAGISHHHGIGRVRRTWMADELGDAGVGVLRAVKAALDPDNLMNPGVLVPD
ncbi:MAG: FAD-binding oxidoreductase [Acidimicrobiia bacterium]|nr:FAD-binding oxidoreductase [Acidimicrobiia bacterium]MCY4434194.1 FAD-binding oxidoreductase [bacterium]